MLLNRKTGLFCYSLQQRIQIAILKFDGLLAAAANQMVPVHCRGGREAFAAIVQMHPPDDAHLFQNLQSAIDRRQAEVGAGTLGLGQDVGGAHPRVGLRDDFHHGSALPREFIALLAELGVERIQTVIHLIHLIENHFQ